MVACEAVHSIFISTRIIYTSAADRAWTRLPNAILRGRITLFSDTAVGSFPTTSFTLFSGRNALFLDDATCLFTRPPHASSRSRCILFPQRGERILHGLPKARFRGRPTIFHKTSARSFTRSYTNLSTKARKLKIWESRFLYINLVFFDWWCDVCHPS